MPKVPGSGSDTQLVPICSVPVYTVNRLYAELKYSEAEFRRKPIQACNIKELYQIVIKELWTENRDAVLAANDRIPESKKIRPITKTVGKIALDFEYSLNAGFWYVYYLESLKSLLVEMSLAGQLFVKYAAGDE